MPIHSINGIDFRDPNVEDNRDGVAVKDITSITTISINASIIVLTGGKSNTSKTVTISGYIIEGPCTIYNYSSDTVKFQGSFNVIPGKTTTVTPVSSGMIIIGSSYTARPGARCSGFIDDDASNFYIVIQNR